MNPRYPIMAALLAASLGTFSLGTSHATPPQPETAPCPPNLTGVTNAINIIAARAACEPQIRVDIGERVARFVLLTEASRPLYVTQQIQDNAASLTEVARIAKDWTRLAPADQVAELYYVLGDAAPPAWVTSDATLRERVKNETNNTNRTGLITYINRRITDGNAQRIAWTGVVENTGLFLSTAAAGAHSIIADPRVRAELEASIVRNEDRPIVPVAPGTGNRSIGQAAQFTTEDAYARGGALATVSGPGDTNSAQFYMKLETQRDPATGELKNFVAIYDNSESPNYIRRVPLTARGPQTIQHAAGRWSLVVDLKGVEGGDIEITLRRPRDTAGANGFMVKASDLGRARFQQAMDKGQMIDVGGKSYYVLAQGGGTTGAHLFYPASLASQPDATWRDLRPELAANTGRVGPDGDFVPVSGKVDLGMVNGRPFHLAYNQTNRKWEVGDGPGDRPAPPTVAGATPGGPTTPGGPQTPGQLADTSGYTEVANNFSEEARTRGYTVRSAANGSGGTDYIVMTPAGFIEGNQVGFGGVRNFRTFSHYVTWEGSDGVARYLDIYLPTVTPDTARRPYFETVALFEANSLRSLTKPGTTEMLWQKDNDVLVDALTNRLRYAEADRTAVVRNLGTVVTAPAEYSIGSAIAGNIQITRKSDMAQYIIWPRVERVQRTAGDNPPATGAEGSTAVSGASQVDDGPFTQTTTLPGQYPAEAYDSETGSVATSGAVVYKKTTTVPAEEEWHLFVKFKETVPGTAAPQPRRTANMLVFSRGAGRYPAPAANLLSLRGYKDTALPVGSTSILVARGHTAARGVWCMRTAPVATPTQLTRVGPVMWWGMQPDEATRICTSEPL